MRRFAALAGLTLLLLSGSLPIAEAADPIATLRAAPIVGEPEAPAMGKVVNTDRRQVRNYPEQPPTIPHKIDGYQVDLNSNKCMTCHSRKAVEESQAPMISITHFMDRENQFLASISPRRYFCTQCHVTQQDVRPLVDNSFVDIDSLLSKPDTQ